MCRHELAIVSALMATLLTLGLAASSQTLSQDESKAANAWMLTPTPYLDWNRDISPSLRAARDQYWDSISMSKGPITTPGAATVSAEGGEDLTVDPYDIPNIPNRVILTATFTSHRSVLTPSEYSLYTEIFLDVDQVFEDRSGSGHPVANGSITALVYGGTVILRSGKPFSVHTEPKELFLRPAHKYLLMLSYHKDGDFYSYVDSWDISDGIVRPNTSRTQYVADAHHSQLSGKSATQIGSILNRELYGNE